MEIPKNLKDEIWEYCRLNDITDLNLFIINMLRQGYNVEKYGATPYSHKEPEIIEKEVIKEVEKIVEVPVEVIKEIVVEKEVIIEVPVEVEKIVELIKEVPVEVIKEVIVEKTLNEGEKDLKNEVIREKRVEIPVEIIKEVVVEKEIIKEVIVEKIVEVPIKSDEYTKKLEQQIRTLKIELELEKNRNYVQPKIEKPIDETTQRTNTGNVISWVSKEERGGKDLYGE